MNDIGVSVALITRKLHRLDVKQAMHSGVRSARKSA